MGLNSCSLGEHIELRGVTNDNLQYGIEDVRGVNNLKELMPTKADISGRDLSKFQIVYPGEFVFNHRTSRNGSKFSIAYNDSDIPIICTEDYVVFRIKESSSMTLRPEWLYMFFNRPEFDRYVITNSWGSSTEFYNWEDICAIKMALPSIFIQDKYIGVYKALLINQHNYERGLEDLKLTIDAELEKYKHSTKRVSLRDIIQESDLRNTDNLITDVQGVNKDKDFMPSVASGADLTKYKLVEQGYLACNLMHVGRDVTVPVALNNSNGPKLVSPAYVVFNINPSVAIPEYILMWLSRNETDRFAWYLCDSSVRSGMEKARFFDIPIPIPPIAEQNALASLHEVLMQRRSLKEQLKNLIKTICPILIKGSIDEARMEA